MPNQDETPDRVNLGGVPQGALPDTTDAPKTGDATGHGDDVTTEATDDTVTLSKGHDTFVGHPSSNSPAEESTDSTSSSYQFGRYRPLRCLGKGDLGAVYLASDSENDRKVVLKLPGFGPKTAKAAIDCFQQATTAAAGLKHANICPVYESGEIEGKWFVAMAFIEGQPLADFVTSSKPPPPRQVAAVVQKIALACGEAHRQDIVHGALRPTMVMIDVDREPQVMNFGFTAGFDRRDLQCGRTTVSPAYTAPEQIDVDLGAIGPAGDIYSLGVILYQLLTGQLPFEGTEQAVVVQILNDDAQMPSKLRPQLHPSLDLICLTMLAKRPQDRYQSMDDVAAALGDYLITEGAASSSALVVMSPTKTAATSPGEVMLLDDFQAACDDYEVRTAQMEAQQKRIQELVDDYEFPIAEKLLVKMADLDDPTLSDFIDWARKQLPVVRNLPRRLSQESEAAHRVAREMMDHHEYDQAASVLRRIPVDYLSEDAAAVLWDAVQLDLEVQELSKAVETAEPILKDKSLIRKVERLLELKPTHRGALELFDRFPDSWKTKTNVTLQEKPTVPTQSRRRRRRRDFPSWVVWPIVGLALVVLAVVVIMNSSRPKEPTGTITINMNIHDPEVTVLIDGNKISDELLESPIRLPTGVHVLTFKRNGRTFQRASFNLSDGQNVQHLVTLSRGKGSRKTRKKRN